MKKRYLIVLIIVVLVVAIILVSLKETNEKTMLKEDYTRTIAAYQQNKSALEAFKKKRVNLYEEPSQLLNEDLIRPDSDLI